MSLTDSLSQEIRLGIEIVGGGINKNLCTKLKHY